MVIVLSKFTHSLGTLVEAHTQSGLVDPKGEVGISLRRVLESYDKAAAASMRANVDPALSTDGKKTARARACDAAEREVEPIKPLEARLAERLASFRQRASATPRAEGDPILNAMAEREIRDRLMSPGKPSRPVKVLYFDAIRDGEWSTVRAIEGAPAVAPLIDEGTRLEGIRLKIERSGSLDEVERLDRELHSLRTVLAAFKHALEGLRLGSSSFSPVSGDRTPDKLPFPPRPFPPVPPEAA